MDELPSSCKILKSLIAPARYSDGPTLFPLCQANDGKGCSIYEQLPDGKCQRWSEALVRGVQQAESTICQRGSQQGSNEQF